MKRLLAITLCACLLLAGCGIPDPPRPAPSRPDAPAAVSAPEQTASSHPQAPSAPAEEPGIEAKPPQEESLSPPQTAELLAAALREGDIPALEALANPAFGVEGKLDYWKTVSIDSVSHDDPEQDGEDWLCRFTLEVSDPGKTPLKAGENICTARIGYAPYGMWDRYSVLSFRPQNEVPVEADLWKNPAVLQVESLRGFSLFDTFDDPAQIDRAAMLDTLLILALRDYREENATPMDMASGFGYTQAQVDAIAKKYFGLDSFVMTDSAFYDGESGCYALAGHGGFYRNERFVRVDEKEGGCVVWIEQYGDPFQLVPAGALQYTLTPNGDGSYRYVSVKEFPEVPES